MHFHPESSKKIKIPIVCVTTTFLIDSALCSTTGEKPFRFRGSVRECEICKGYILTETNTKYEICKVYILTETNTKCEICKGYILTETNTKCEICKGYVLTETNTKCEICKCYILPETKTKGEICKGYVLNETKNLNLQGLCTHWDKYKMRKSHRQCENQLRFLRIWRERRLSPRWKDRKYVVIITRYSRVHTLHVCSCSDFSAIVLLSDIQAYDAAGSISAIF